MSEAKRGRPKKDGATAVWESVKKTEPVKAALKDLEQRMTVAPLRGQTPDPVALAQQFQKLELLDFLLDNLDLVQKFSNGDFAKAAKEHPALAELLDDRLRIDVYKDKRYKTSIDAALKSYMNGVLIDRQRPLNNADKTNEAERRAIKTKEHAKALKISNGGKLPPKYWISIAESLFKDGFTGRGGEYVSERTILNDLKPPKK